MTPLRFSISRFVTLAAAFGLAALLVTPRASAADAATNPSPAAVTNAPATPAAVDPKAVPGTNAAASTPLLPAPTRDDRGENRGAENSQTSTNSPPAVVPTNAPAPELANAATNAAATNAVAPDAASATAATPASAPTANRPSTTPSRDSKFPPAAGTTAPRIDLSTFKILSERNIFDPNRSSRGSRYTPPASDTPPPRRAAPTSVEAFSLVGTLAYGENQMAFIDGGSSQFKKALRLNDTVVGLKLKSVTANQATFDNGGADLAVRVGHGLRREDRGPWQVNTQPTAYAAAPSTSSSPSGTNAPPTAAAGTTADPAAASTPPAPGAPTVAAKAEPAPTAAEAEALRRLLEKRRKEEEK